MLSQVAQTISVLIQLLPKQLVLPFEDPQLAIPLFRVVKSGTILHFDFSKLMARVITIIFETVILIKSFTQFGTVLDLPRNGIDFLLQLQGLVQLRRNYFEQTHKQI